MKVFSRLLFIFLFVGSTLAAVPEISKVEPPNWWANQSIGSKGNPLRVLIRGRNLTGAKVQPPAGFKVNNSKVNSAGTYLLLDLTINKNTKPGTYLFKLTTNDGAADVRFEIAVPFSRQGNFQGFSQDDVIYLLMPDRFANGDSSNDDPASSKGLFDRSKSRYYHGGDLQGVINKLPYLKDLGITAIWMNPIYDNTNNPDMKEVYDGQPTTGYHGYGAIDFYAVDEHLGDVKKFRELVEKAHALGLKIIQDQVANHCGPYHPWVNDSPTPTWFNGTEANHINENWQTHLVMDKYASPNLLKPVLDGWFVNFLPDLNQNDPEVAKYIIQNTLWWIGISGMDAIRQDTLPYVPRQFWNQWMTAIKREYPNVNVVGETLDGLPAQVAFFQGGAKRFDGVDSKIDTEFDYPLFYPLRRVFAEGQSTKQLVEILNQDYLYTAPEKLVTLLGSHDVGRFMNERGATAEGLKLALTFLLTTRGIPQLYYGDEIAMRGGNDPDNRREFPGGWNGDSRNAFEAAERTAEENKVFEHLKKLLHIRNQMPHLRGGTLQHLAITDQAYIFLRGLTREQNLKFPQRTNASLNSKRWNLNQVLVAFNNDTKAAEIECDSDKTVFEYVKEGGVNIEEKLGTGGKLHVIELGQDKAKIMISLPPRSAAIFHLTAK